MKVSELGEFGLIERLRAALGAPADERLIVGIGDDAAVWQSGETYVIATTDTMVAGVHFLPDSTAWRDVGWKAIAVNISDVAAMGGTPALALVTLCLPPDTDVAAIDDLYAGMREIAELSGVSIGGGDIVAAPAFTVTVALLGEAYVNDGGRPLLLRRNAAQPGNVVCVTGPLGGAAAGLRVLRDSSIAERLTAEQRDELIGAQVRPWPRIDAGDLAVRAGITCGMDISDGLAQDLGHICRASGVDAELRLDAIPVSGALTALFPEEAAVMAATGGEDYELLLIGGGQTLELADQALRRHRQTPDERQIFEVGRITGPGAGRVRVIDAAGREVELASPGWDHLRGTG